MGRVRTRLHKTVEGEYKLLGKSYDEWKHIARRKVIYEWLGDKYDQRNLLSKNYIVLILKTNRRFGMIVKKLGWVYIQLTEGRQILWVVTITWIFFKNT